ncbi:MAG: hypothetical protein QCH35_04495 [Methanomicrobiaceae archaeon]|nr:hypothetical protein [Methanomicrobiaceae archaeon]
MSLLRRCPECGAEFFLQSSCCSHGPCQDTYRCPRCGLALREPVRVVLSHSWDDE